MAWWVLSWALHASDDPQTLLRALRDPHRGDWRTAYTLAELLRNPQNRALREDTSLCRELASILEERLEDRSPDSSQAALRVFLCRALGEFHAVDGLPALLHAAEAGQRKGARDVQCAALEALAVLAGNLGPSAVRRDPRVVAVLLDASQASSGSEAAAEDDRVAATAAFALGVVGGPAAGQRLRELLDDQRPDVRYNAATGLAREGDAAAIPVLLEMLTTDTSLSVRDARQRELVMLNAARAARFFTAQGSAERQPLIEALARVHDASELSPALRAAAEAARAELSAVDSR
jgi:HEAT repeat protein